jgi:hypothetical protein
VIRKGEFIIVDDFELTHDILEIDCCVDSEGILRGCKFTNTVFTVESYLIFSSDMMTYSPVIG